jgi:capsular polysaccharide biosynthesis protein
VLAAKTVAARGNIVRGVQHDLPRDVRQHKSFARHPIQATEQEAAHVREVVDAGESPSTPAILVGIVLAFIVPIATVLMLLAFGAGHLSA